MTGDFAQFFNEVRRAAEKYGIKAHLICGVASDGAGGQVKVASNGHHTFDKKNEQFIERCVDAMEESVDSTLARLADGDAPPQYLS